MKYVLYKPRVKRPHPRNVTCLKYCSAPSVTFTIILLGLLGHSQLLPFSLPAFNLSAILPVLLPQYIPSQLIKLHLYCRHCRSGCYQVLPRPPLTFPYTPLLSPADHFLQNSYSDFFTVNHINRSICLKALHLFTFALRIKFICLIKAYESSLIYFLLTSQISYVVYFCLHALDKLALASELQYVLRTLVFSAQKFLSQIFYPNGFFLVITSTDRPY